MCMGVHFFLSAHCCTTLAVVDKGMRMDMGTCTCIVKRTETWARMWMCSWADGHQSTFWAYEQTSLFDVTPACQARTAPCFNHHIIKNLSMYLTWAGEECRSTKHGIAHGGFRRLLPSILCR